MEMRVMLIMTFDCEDKHNFFNTKAGVRGWGLPPMELHQTGMKLAYGGCGLPLPIIEQPKDNKTERAKIEVGGSPDT